ncbi:MAG: tRNA (adenosine(37)-N6)-dimethylallyltransferase MiaA [Planctomycetota bacterium]
MTPPLLVITGPTAAGKSQLALTLAGRFGCEILSMDSMAVYRGMDIGTAKPSVEERARVPHHLIDLVDPHEEFDTSRWCAAAESAVADVQRRGRTPLLVGGTPLYLMAFGKGLIEGPAADPALRAELAAREAADPGCLHGELRQRDPAAAARIHVRDVKRITRALEYVLHTGAPISARQTTFADDVWRRPCRVLAVHLARTELHDRVKARTKAMLAGGLLDEVRAIAHGCGFSRTAAAGIGYRECLDYLAGRYKDEEELRNRIRRNTHKLIRRQTTWLRRLPEVSWWSAHDDVEVAAQHLWPHATEAGR